MQVLVEARVVEQDVLDALLNVLGVQGLASHRPVRSQGTDDGTHPLLRKIRRVGKLLLTVSGGLLAQAE